MTSGRERSRVRLILCSLAIVLLTVACDGVDAKLQAVHEFAQRAAVAEPILGAVSSDYYASCVRTYNWEYAALPDRAKAAFEPVEDWCGKTHALDATRQWQMTNSVLLAYLRGLGDLAGGQANNYGIPQFVDDIVADNEQTHWFNLDSSTATNVKNFGEWVARTYFAGRRAAALADVIRQADPYVQDLTTSLTTIAIEQYRQGALRAESTALNKFYVTTHSPGQTLVLSDRIQWMRDRQVLADRYPAIDAYVDVLDKIRKAHAALVKLFQAGTALDPAIRSASLAALDRDLTVLRSAYAVPEVAR